ncbi:XdhC family protein [Micromonospora sp. ATA51]|uniref:XdhC family protein n=1 Tax=Micromonospora sp. ATA51 TaxID=2806098 RepID=UPI001EE40761|nr:XdhC family protein [Micromonospora sp. ATA51]
MVTCVAADAGDPPALAAPADPAGRLGRRLVLTEDGTSGTLGGERLDAAASADALGLLAAGRGAVLRYGYDGSGAAAASASSWRRTPRRPG